MGLISLFDKSFLQSLSIEESVWYDHFFHPNISPLFYVETLADLTKATSTSGKTAEDLVRTIADKTPVLNGAPCAHHQQLCISSLMGQHIPMSGQIPVVGGRMVRTADGKKGAVFDQPPEAQAFSRWQEGKFQDVERMFAQNWRRMLTSLDLPATAKRLQVLGITGKDYKSIDDAYALASGLVHSNTKPFDQMALLFEFVNIPHQLHRPILERWSIEQQPSLATYAPYAAHVLTVEIFFQVALAANLIATERASNRIDIAYLFYLPFCQLFISSDKLHRRCAAPFLRADQDFVWGPDIKAELTRLNREFSKLPEEIRERGIMKAAPRPTGGPDDLIIRLWDRHAPGWNRPRAPEAPVSPEAQRLLLERLRQLRKLPAIDRHDDEGSGNEDDLDQLSIERLVPKRKGSIWLLPKHLKVEPE